MSSEVTTIPTEEKICSSSHINTVSCQSQNHGFTFENNIRKNVFGLSAEKNNTDKHDIPKEKNKYNKTENCSIKTTGSSTICCADILSFYNYNFKEQNTIIVIKYSQTETHKTIEHIYEINYNEKCHQLLFGDLPKEVIEEYVKNVKSIPKKTKGEDSKKIFNYIDEKKQIKEKYAHIIQINPKVDSSQSRVQCSITNFEETLKDFITYKSLPDSRNSLRGNKIISSIESSRRTRNKKPK